MDFFKTSNKSNVNTQDIFEKAIGCDFTIAIAGNPNVGKSTVFNGLTGMHQHTGNWPGKTVTNACGSCKYKNKNFLLVDIPGTYSLMSNSEEEEIARNYICFGNPDATVVIVDATCLERNLNLVYQIFEITKNVIVCVNLLDEAQKKGINIDLKSLASNLGVPVVGTTARNSKTLKKLIDTIYNVCTGIIKCEPNKVKYSPAIENSIQSLNPYINYDSYISDWICLKLLDDDIEIIKSIETNLKINLGSNKLLKKSEDIKDILIENGITSSNFKNNIISSIVIQAEKLAFKVCSFKNSSRTLMDIKIDKVLTSKKFGIPIMIFFLGMIFWITITGANYPSKLLFNFFEYMEKYLINFFSFINAPNWLKGVLIDGAYNTLSWIIAVMLPPMAIFFPLFTFLEDLGYLPRIAFNLDNYFRKSGCSGKQSLTMCMGFGCNAAGVSGTKIIDSPREKLLAILTNAFVPCNGRFPFLICISTIFIGCFFTGIGSSVLSAFAVLVLITFGIIMTLFVSKILSKTILKGIPSSFILELPPYRKPQLGKILVRSIFDRTLFILGRAIVVAIPAGIVIWAFANIFINDLSLLSYIANFLDPFANLMGLDGYILTAFILGIPANEIVLPILLMGYIQSNTLISLEDFSSIKSILVQNGWSLITAINVMIFSLLHFPCSTTLLTIKKETNSWKWVSLSFVLPTICGIIICIVSNLIYSLCLSF